MINIHEGPRKAVLYSTGTYEPVLVLMDYGQYHPLEPVRENFGDDFQAAIQERDRTEVIGRFLQAGFWDQGNEPGVDACEVEITMVQVITKLVDVLFYNVPTSFDESSIKAIRAGGTIRRHRFDHLVYFSVSERS